MNRKIEGLIISVQQPCQPPNISIMAQQDGREVVWVNFHPDQIETLCRLLREAKQESEIIAAQQTPPGVGDVAMVYAHQPIIPK